MNEPTSLKIGSIVTISVFEEDFFIHSEGFVQKDIEAIDLYNGRPNQRLQGCLFQIYPQFINTFKEEALQSLSKWKSSAGDGQMDGTDESNLLTDMNIGMVGEQPRAEAISIFEEEGDVKIRIKEHQAKISREFKYNQDTFEKQKGEDVTYNLSIQFVHVASGKYLSCHEREAKIEKDSFKLWLDDYPSNKTVFQIQPAFKYQCESDSRIFSEDTIKIVSQHIKLRKTIYLHANLSVLEENEKMMQDFPPQTNNPTEQSFEMVQQHYSSMQSLREVNMSLDNPTFWRIKLFQDIQDTKKAY